ncbi:uncharacterized protein FIBRA_04365 [Fibroporia radiculosa]|uniref:Uncharacterized protein n=1 Tax=Fibroporia radiculosa TaxID=599839 RepID=J4GP54_9APHY|nr:uncharacterized protein FIBRA_04365 [Fibroporia radiculosa]CCM02280.1 predicted protein [Fibroporia radiculosa]
MSEPWTTPIAVTTGFSFVGFLLVSVPLYWHLEAWNVGCVLYIFWSGTGCLIQFINMVVWQDNVINWVPVWCDITSRWRYAAAIGICTASLVINRRLYKIASVSVVSISKADKRRMMYVDLAIGLVPPIVVVALYWFIEGHRFNIYEGFGCMFVFPATILSYFLYQLWPIVIGLIAAYYCVRTLIAFVKRRRQFRELISSNSNLTYHRYLRLMGLATIEILCTVPMGIWVVVNNARNTLYVWHGLANVHYDFSRVDQYPSIIWWTDSLLRPSILTSMWDMIVCSLVFFAFFGLAEEARKHYRATFTYITKRLGLSTLSLSSAGTEGQSGYNASKLPSSALPHITIPSFVQPGQPSSSGDSFSDRLSSSIPFDDEIPRYDEKTHYAMSPESDGASTCIPSPMSPEDVEAQYEAMVLPAFPEPTYDAMQPPPHTSSPVHSDSSDMRTL